MKKVARVWESYKTFANDSDYFWLVDSLCLISEQRPPLTKRFGIRMLWVILRLLHAFQYFCFVFRLIRCIMQTPEDMETFTAMTNLVVPLGVATLRGLCLAYHRDSVLKLKQYVNSKSCQRDDNVGAFELRRQMFRKVNRYLVAFHCVTTLNSCSWGLTSGLHEDIFKIPFSMDGLPDGLKPAVDLGFAIFLIPWCFTIWHSTTLFVPMLSILHTELSIIVGQFDGLFEKVVANYALEPSDLDQLPTIQRSRFWAELDMTFKSAISHHSAFISNLQLLRKISSLNFFIFLCTSALIITFNIFPSIAYPSLENLPLQLVALQYATEAYLYCTMFDNLENENNRIANHVYAIDWLYSAGKSSKLDQTHRKSILQNALILNRQVKAGLAIRAGGIFPLQLMTFTQMIKSIYSLLTLMLQSTE